MDLKKIKKIHFIGICGYIMSATAVMLKKRGYQVSGSDQNAYLPTTDLIDRAGIKRWSQYSPANLQKSNLVVIGNHINKENPEAQAALKRNFQVVSLPRLLGQFFEDKKRIVVAGTHGKSTTTALAAWLLEAASLKPSFLIGGLIRNIDRSFQLNKGEFVVIEGDEYRTAFFDQRPKFFHYKPEIAVLTTCEFDHPDFFQDLPAVKKVFFQFLNLVPENGLVIAGIDDQQVAELIKRLQRQKITYGLTKKADYQAIDISFGQKTKFKVLKKGKLFGSFSILLPGRINVQNSLAVIALADYLKVNLKTIKQALASFQGVRRRFEIIGQPRGIVIIDDYAHHPTKIKKTLAAVRNCYPQAKIYAIFEPHTYSRTKALLADYGRAFKKADEVIITPLMPAREKGSKPIVSSQNVVEAVKRHHSQALFLDTNEKIVNYLCQRLKPGEVVIMMSVSDLDNLGGQLVNAVQAK